MGGIFWTQLKFRNLKKGTVTFKSWLPSLAVTVHKILQHKMITLSSKNLTVLTERIPKELMCSPDPSSLKSSMSVDVNEHQGARRGRPAHVWRHHDAQWYFQALKQHMLPLRLHHFTGSRCRCSRNSFCSCDKQLHGCTKEHEDRRKEKTTDVGMSYYCRNRNTEKTNDGTNKLKSVFNIIFIIRLWLKNIWIEMIIFKMI